MRRIRLFGPPEITDVQGQPIRLPPYAMRVLAYLWLNRHRPQTRGRLVGVFWPESSEVKARTNLRQALYQVRRTLEPEDEGRGSCLRLTRNTAQFRPDAPCWVDAGEFEAKLAQAERETKEARGRLLQEVIALYRGPFLEGHYEDWALEEAERLRGRYREALDRLIRFYHEQGEPEEALPIAQQQLAEAPLEEAAHRQLMALYAILGERDTALRQYEACRRTLEKELRADARPESATEELAQRIEAGADNEELVAWAPSAGEAPLPDLPSPTTRFIGRASEIHEVKRRLRTGRLLTLTGAGGAGKTRLALEAAWDQIESYDDGITWVDLAPLTDPKTVPQTVASALDVDERPGRSLSETLVDALQAKQLLLVLDNCEHLVEACVELVGRLLTACPQVSVMVTSREVLRVSGEAVWEVPPLATPEPDADAERSLKELGTAEAVQLFLDRARLNDARFRLTEENAAAVARICRQLDGLPLALELAAARVRALSVQEIAQRLEDRFRLLRTGSRSADPRHQTLEAALEWSWALLSEPERALLRRLAVFRGGFTLEAAEAVCAGEGIEETEVLDRLAGLAEKSLVAVRKDGGEARYHLLETVCQYARRKLEAAGEMEEIHKRHRALFLALAEEAAAELGGEGMAEWLTRLAREHANLRTALEQALAAHPEAALRLAEALGPFWEIRGHWTEGREALQRALERAEGVPLKQRARATKELGYLEFQQGSYERAKAHLEESLELSRGIGDQDGIVRALIRLGPTALYQGNPNAAWSYLEEGLAVVKKLEDNRGIAAVATNLGLVALQQGDYDEARRRFEESLAIARDWGNKEHIATTLLNLGVVAHRLGDHETARRRYDESLQIHKEVGDRKGIAKILGNLGLVALDQGHLEEAKQRLGEALAIGREIGDKPGTVEFLRGLGSVALEKRDLEDARRCFEEGLTLAHEMGLSQEIALNLVGFAKVACVQERMEQAAKLLGAGDASREAIGAPLPLNRRESFDRYVASVRAELGEAAFNTACEAGRQMPLEEAIELALELTG